MTAGPGYSLPFSFLGGVDTAPKTRTDAREGGRVTVSAISYVNRVPGKRLLSASSF
jgi:hypothetical protein